MATPPRSGGRPRSWPPARFCPGCSSRAPSPRPPTTPRPPSRSWRNELRPHDLNAKEADMSTIDDVLVITGAGGIDQAIARRQGPGKHILFADISEDNQAAAAAALADLGQRVGTQRVDVSSRESVHALAEKAAELL